MSCLTTPGCSSSTNNRVFNEKPSGAFDCINLAFTTLNTFDPDSLVIRLDGNTLDPIQYILNVGNDGFTLVVDPANPKALGCPPQSEECLRVDYNPSSTGSSSECLTLL